MDSYGFICAFSIAVVFCISLKQSYATIQELSTQFTAGKRVTSSHTTIASVSKIQCVEKCIRADRDNNTCNAAGYNRNTRSCQLSLDQQQDVVTDPDPSSGVFFMNGIGTKYDFNNFIFGYILGFRAQSFRIKQNCIKRIEIMYRRI